MEHKILIVDAHPVYAPRLEGFLRGLTFQHIFRAATGGEGVAAARRLRPDLAIVSGMLPDTDAADCCARIRATSPVTRIIVLVGLFTDEEQAARLRLSGAGHVLPRREKDWQPLQDAVQDCLGLNAGPGSV